MTQGHSDSRIAHLANQGSEIVLLLNPTTYVNTFWQVDMRSAFVSLQVEPDGAAAGWLQALDFAPGVAANQSLPNCTAARYERRSSIGLLHNILLGRSHLESQ